MPVFWGQTKYQGAGASGDEDAEAEGEDGKPALHLVYRVTCILAGLVYIQSVQATGAGRKAASVEGAGEPCRATGAKGARLNDEWRRDGAKTGSSG